MSVYSHYASGKCIEKKEPASIVIDFNRLNLKPGQIIVDSKLRNKGGNSFENLFVTSGLLTCKSNDKISVANTNTHNFRLLIDHCETVYKESSIGKKEKVAWKNSSITCKARINSIIKNETESGMIPVWAGFHLFGRYKTENDLYVASIRIDGNITIKKKKGGEYITLGVKKMQIFDVGKIFCIMFNINETTLSLYVDNILVLKVEDNNDVLESGTHGIRTDYCDVDVFSIMIK